MSDKKVKYFVWAFFGALAIFAFLRWYEPPRLVIKPEIVINMPPYALVDSYGRHWSSFGGRVEGDGIYYLQGCFVERLNSGTGYTPSISEYPCTSYYLIWPRTRGEYETTPER